MNPVEEFLAEKRADALPTHGRSFGNAFAQGAGAGIASAALEGLASAATKIMDAATAKGHFREMLEWNQDLKDENPKWVNQAFRTLRHFAPDMSKDPLVAGAMVRRMVVSGLEGAPGVIQEALSGQKNMDGLVRKAYGQGVSKGVGEGIKDFQPFGSPRRTGQPPVAVNLLGPSRVYHHQDADQ